MQLICQQEVNSRTASIMFQSSLSAKAYIFANQGQQGGPIKISDNRRELFCQLDPNFRDDSFYNSFNLNSRDLNSLEIEEDLE